MLCVVSKPRRDDHFKHIQREKLLRLRDALVDSISRVAPRKLPSLANGSEAPVSVGDRADAGSDAAQRDFAMNLLSQEHGALAEIDRALQRIESGTYGVCEMSGKTIPRPRLQALPFARYTVECQAQLEKESNASKSWPRMPRLYEWEIEEEAALEAATALERMAAAR
jgi:DnaK suppressor protein